jgi:hypothetical protein
MGRRFQEIIDEANKKLKAKYPNRNIRIGYTYIVNNENDKEKEEE